MMPVQFMTLPSEIWEFVFLLLDPKDVGRVGMTCKTLSYVLDDRTLHKGLYRQRLDEPVEEFLCTNFDYVSEVRRFVWMEDVIKTSGQDKTHIVKEVSRYISNLLRTSQPENSRTLKQVRRWFKDDIRNRENIEMFLCQSKTFNFARKSQYRRPLLSYDDRQASAKLRCLYGLSAERPGWPSRQFKHVYPWAISVVYDLRNYTRANFWGPYRSDGLATVDWERVEAVMMVLGKNMEVFKDHRGDYFKARWEERFVGATPNSFKPSPEWLRSVEIPLSAKDPFDIEGTWCRVVCFLDFHDLFAYNFGMPPPPDDQPRQPLNTHEAIRLIIMEVKLTHLEEPGENDGQGYPIVHFEGLSRSITSRWDPNANSNIRGSVRLTREGEVRWKTISVYGGEERWASEGIQVGGVRSGRGVLGHWFDKNFDEHGPAGPTAFWKIKDTIDDNPPSDQTDWIDQFVDDDADEENNVEEDDEEEELGEEVLGQIDLHGHQGVAAMLFMLNTAGMNIHVGHQVGHAAHAAALPAAEQEDEVQDEAPVATHDPGTPEIVVFAQRLVTGFQAAGASRDGASTAGGSARIVDESVGGEDRQETPTEEEEESRDG